jgi:ribulose-5-phosphate 4-epimerase/fuculose-1-phosphate aldolase
LDEQVIAVGGGVEVAEYGASASDELAGNAVAGLADRGAVLLRHHGVLGVGADLDEAVSVVELVERVAKIYTLARSLGGEVALLPPGVIESEQRVYRMMKGFK